MTKTAAEVREELERMNRKGKGKHDWFGMKEGVKYVRIGPPWKKGGEFWKDVPYHGTFNEKIYCPHVKFNKETGKPRFCKICKRIAELKGDRSIFAKKLWTLIRQKNESLWNVLVAKIRRTDDGIKVKRYIDNHFKIWRLSMQWHKMMIELFANEDYRRKSILGITHMKYGRLVRVKRTGTGRDDTTYTFIPVDHISPVFPTKEQRNKIKRTLVDLDSIVYPSSSEEIDAFLRKMEKRAKKLAALEKEEEGIEEDEEEDDVEEDEDEEETTHKKKHHHRDEEDEDDELERKYKKMKSEMKKMKREEDEDEED